MHDSTEGFPTAEYKYKEGILHEPMIRLLRSEAHQGVTANIPASKHSLAVMK